MGEDTIGAVKFALEVLRRCLVKNNVSIGYNKKDNSLFFFDTKTYLEEKKINGFRVKLEDLVR